MTKNEINDCKKTINDFFGKNSFDNLLGIFGVTEQDLENIEEDETAKDILNEESLINIFDIFDDFLDRDTDHNKENRKNINIEEVKETDKKESPSEQLPSELPSDKLKDINKKLDIHKIVQEYVTEQNISNDDYAKLFEFACWLINK